MKSIGIFILTALTLASCKTTNVSKCPAISFTGRAQVGEFAQPTANLDTLYLLEKDPMAIQTFKIWAEDTVEKVKPAIIFVSSDQMTCIKKRCNGQIKEIN